MQVTERQTAITPCDVCGVTWEQACEAARILGCESTGWQTTHGPGDFRESLCGLCADRRTRRFMADQYFALMAAIRHHRATIHATEPDALRYAPYDLELWAHLGDQPASESMQEPATGEEKQC